MYRRQSDSEKLNIRDGQRYVRRTEIASMCGPNVQLRLACGLSFSPGAYRHPHVQGRGCPGYTHSYSISHKPLRASLHKAFKLTSKIQASEIHTFS